MTSDQLIAAFTGLQTAAVVFGLVFVSAQLRESRRIARGGAYQGWLDTMLAFFMMLADNEGLSQLYWKGRRDLKSLNEIEVSPFFYLCVTYFTLIENLYVQYEEGLIPKEVFLPWQYGFADGLKGNGFAEYWRLESAQFAPVFRDFVDGVLREQVGAAGETKMSAFWSLVNTQTAHDGPGSLGEAAGTT